MTHTTIFICAHQCIEPGGDEARNVLSLADSIEAKMVALSQRLVQAGKYKSGAAILEHGIEVTAELRGLINDEATT